ncbi:MAG: hypothetical protein ACKO01_05435 [Erythrobacter sp.]
MPRERTPSPPLLVNRRAIPRQATSRVAFAELGIPDDDPLLDFLPYCHKAPRGNSITPDVQRAFVHELAATGIVKQAATRVGKSLEALYKLRARPGAEDFARAWDEALEWGRLRLEDCAMERAIGAGLSNLRANSMLAFVIRLRSHHMIDCREVKPGHWLYESIRYDLTGVWGEEGEEEEDPSAGEIGD